MTRANGVGLHNWYMRTVGDMDHKRRHHNRTRLSGGGTSCLSDSNGGGLEFSENGGREGVTQWTDTGRIDDGEEGVSEQP